MHNKYFTVHLACPTSKTSFNSLIPGYFFIEAIS